MLLAFFVAVAAEVDKTDWLIGYLVHRFHPRHCLDSLPPCCGRLYFISSPTPILLPDGVLGFRMGGCFHRYLHLKHLKVALKTLHATIHRASLATLGAVGSQNSGSTCSRVTPLAVS
jgi:hypothetical protein